MAAGFEPEPELVGDSGSDEDAESEPTLASGDDSEEPAPEPELVAGDTTDSDSDGEAGQPGDGRQHGELDGGGVQATPDPLSSKEARVQWWRDKARRDAADRSEVAAAAAASDPQPHALPTQVPYAYSRPPPRRCIGADVSFCGCLVLAARAAGTGEHRPRPAVAHLASTLLRWLTIGHRPGLGARRRRDSFRVSGIAGSREAHAVQHNRGGSGVIHAVGSGAIGGGGSGGG